MSCCKLGHTIKKKLLSLCYSKEPSVITEEHPIFLDGALCTIHVTTITSIDNYSKKCKIIHSRSYTQTPDYSDNIDAPWLWIGATAFWGDCDMTASLLPYVVEGNKITLELLCNIFPFHRNWKYLDSVTFKEVDFPEDGITITK